nr:HepT-like ribonuclease domain-containing protein [Intrasporangium sp.]
MHRCQEYAPHLRSGGLASMAYDALLRSLAVIGEAVRSLPSETRAVLPDVPWASIAGLRNIVVHEYFRVNPELILDIVDHQLVDLASLASAINCCSLQRLRGKVLPVPF